MTVIPPPAIVNAQFRAGFSSHKAYKMSNRNSIII